MLGRGPQTVQSDTDRGISATDLKKLCSGNLSISVLVVQLEGNWTHRSWSRGQRKTIKIRGRLLLKCTNTSVCWSCCWPVLAASPLWFDSCQWVGNEPEPGRRWESPPFLSWTVGGKRTVQHLLKKNQVTFLCSPTKCILFKTLYLILLGSVLF